MLVGRTSHILGEVVTIYYVNRNFVNLTRLFLPLGVALLSGFFLESMANVKNLSFLFLVVGLVSNHYYPEIVKIEGEKLKLKLALSKKYREFSLAEMEVSADNRGRYLILHLNRNYRLDVKTLPVELYYKLKPYIKIIEG